MAPLLARNLSTPLDPIYILIRPALVICDIDLNSTVLRTERPKQRERVRRGRDSHIINGIVSN